MRARVKAGQCFSGEIPMLHRDGSVFPAYFTSTPVTTPHGEVVGRIGVIRDLTEQRRLEAELRTRHLRGSAVAVLGARALAKGRDNASSDEALVQEGVDTTRRLLGADRATLFEVQSDGSLLARAVAPRAATSTAVKPAAAHWLVSPSWPARWLLWRTSRSSAALTAAPSPANASRRSPPPVPGRLGVRGVLSAERFTMADFDDAAADFLQSMANVIGSALN